MDIDEIDFIVCQSGQYSAKESDNLAHKLLLSIGTALCNLYKNGLIHGDLNDTHILFNAHQNVKLIGLSFRLTLIRLK